MQPQVLLMGHTWKRWGGHVCVQLAAALPAPLLGCRRSPRQLAGRVLQHMATSGGAAGCTLHASDAAFQCLPMLTCTHASVPSWGTCSFTRGCTAGPDRQRFHPSPPHSGWRSHKHPMMGKSSVQQPAHPFRAALTEVLSDKLAICAAKLSAPVWPQAKLCLCTV